MKPVHTPAKRLTTLDANLLVALDIFIEERHITRAARRLGVSQPAASHMLQRVREALDDPILVRSGSSMVLTPRARAMAPLLRQALRQLELAVGGTALFEPTTATRDFRVAMLDIYATSLIPALTAALITAGPGLSLEVLPLQMDQVFEQLRDARVDLAVIGSQWPPPQDINSATLFDDRLACLVRRGHPILGHRKITPRLYTRWPHVNFRISGQGQHAIDHALEKQGLQRRVVCRLPYFQIAPMLVADSDVIVNLPHSLTRTFERQWPVSSFPPPLALGAYGVVLVWPRFLDAAPDHRWLRALVQSLAAPAGPSRRAR